MYHSFIHLTDLSDHHPGALLNAGSRSGDSNWHQHLKTCVQSLAAAAAATSSHRPYVSAYARKAAKPSPIKKKKRIAQHSHAGVGSLHRVVLNSPGSFKIPNRVFPPRFTSPKDAQPPRPLRDVPNNMSQFHAGVRHLHRAALNYPGSFPSNMSQSQQCVPILSEQYVPSKMFYSHFMATKRRALLWSPCLSPNKVSHFAGLASVRRA
eukprot:gene534-1946_t